jgi:uncharacterized phage protein (TIGR01671 family)
MRDIKFRTWDGQNMVPCGIANSIGHPIRTNTCDFEQMTLDAILLPKDTPVMQFTGLLDKNGKEIFEGDILNLEFSRISKQESYFTVIFKDGCFGVTPLGIKYAGCENFIKDESRVFSAFFHNDYHKLLGFPAEVMGNIHEHKHLLSNQEEKA